MPKLSMSREPRIKKSISFRPDQIEAIDAQADREGHGNVSLIVQRAVDHELNLSAAPRHAAPQPTEQAA